MAISKNELGALLRDVARFERSLQNLEPEYARQLNPAYLARQGRLYSERLKKHERDLMQLDNYRSVYSNFRLLMHMKSDAPVSAYLKVIQQAREGLRNLIAQGISVGVVKSAVPVKSSTKDDAVRSKAKYAIAAHDIEMIAKLMRADNLERDVISQQYALAQSAVKRFSDATMLAKRVLGDTPKYRNLLPGPIHSPANLKRLITEHNTRTPSGALRSKQQDVLAIAAMARQNAVFMHNASRRL